MAFHLSDLVLQGELYHSSPLCVHGVLLLRGTETPIAINLTGTPAADLRGKNFTFEAPHNDHEPTEEDRRRVHELALQQIGPIEEMTAARMMKAIDRLPGEDEAETDPSGSPASRLVPGLYMEWFSQNGRVVLELPEPNLEFFDIPERPKIELPEIGDEDFPELAPPAAEEDPEEKGYGLVPAELDRELEHAALQTDFEIASGSDEASADMEEWELFDHLIETEDGAPLAEVVEGMPLPPPTADLSDAEVEKAFKSALARMALNGIALDICKHCSVRDAYRILMEKVFPEGTSYREMRASKTFVQHYATSDYCKACQDEPFD